MRVWAGKQKKGVVIQGVWRGAGPVWNIGAHTRSEEVPRLKVGNVERTMIDSPRGKFPSYKVVINPKAEEVSESKRDRLT